MNKKIKNAVLVSFPNTSPSYNFSFGTVTEDGNFNFHFQWKNERWNCWVTTPKGDVRQCSVYPNVISWLGFLDYGIMFNTSLTEISFNELFNTELYILKWK